VLPERALDVIQMPPAMHGAHEVDRGTDGGVSGDELLWKLLCARSAASAQVMAISAARRGATERKRGLAASLIQPILALSSAGGVTRPAAIARSSSFSREDDVVLGTEFRTRVKSRQRREPRRCTEEA
jgi:hypothetical protein